MDRNIPIEEIRKRKVMIAVRVVALIVTVIVGVIIGVQFLRDSLYLKDLNISEVDRGTIEVSVSATGTVRAFDEIINSPVSTRILEVYCQEGDSVEVGTPLLKLDLQTAEADFQNAKDQSQMHRLNGEIKLQNLEMQVKVCEMKVDRLATNVRNERYLDSLGSGTMDKVREAELTHQTALLELQQLKEQLRAEERVQTLEQSISDKNVENLQRTLADAQIRATRKAVVTFINKDIGAQVSQGEKVAVVSDLSHFKIEGDVVDAYSDRVLVGGRVVVKFGNTQLDGTIATVTPLSKNGVINFTVRLADPSHSRLRPGMKTDVYIMHAVRDDVLRIHNGSYYIGAGSYDLFVLTSENEITRRKVRLGDSNFDYVEVISGLSPGENVVISDMKDYKNRERMKVK